MSPRLEWVAPDAPEMARLYALRHEVFVLEQRVPVELERDDHDDHAAHLAAWSPEDGRAVGVLRVVALPPSAPAPRVAKIGRVAVPQDMRGRGIAAAMMREALAWARAHGFDEAYLHAQWDARGLYERLGFVPEGDTFDDAGILHIAMRLRL